MEVTTTKATHRGIEIMVMSDNGGYGTEPGGAYFELCYGGDDSSLVALIGDSIPLAQWYCVHV